MRRTVLMLLLFIPFSLVAQKKTYTLEEGNVYKYVNDTITTEILDFDAKIRDDEYIKATTDFKVRKLSKTSEYWYGPIVRGRIMEMTVKDTLTCTAGQFLQYNSSDVKVQAAKRGTIIPLHEENRYLGEYVVSFFLSHKTSERSTDHVDIYLNNFEDIKLYYLVLYKDSDGWYDLSTVNDKEGGPFLLDAKSHAWFDDIKLKEDVEYIVVIAFDSIFTKFDVKNILKSLKKKNELSITCSGDFGYYFKKF